MNAHGPSLLSVVVLIKVAKLLKNRAPVVDFSFGNSCQRPEVPPLPSRRVWIVRPRHPRGKLPQFVHEVFRWQRLRNESHRIEPAKRCDLDSRLRRLHLSMWTRVFTARQLRGLFRRAAFEPAKAAFTQTRHAEPGRSTECREWVRTRCRFGKTDDCA